ncbi:ATP-binding protein [Promicromonospora alba]|uniref:ATP-binding protein n=1 Tax=Promicromonospora alba TaxID=1616110 RepID=A0ABV9HPX9_9MICO
MATFDDAINAVLAGASADELETTMLEFKQESDSIKHTFETITDAVVCFANSVGGTVIVGVADKGRGIDALLGVSPGLQQGLVKGIFDRTRPSLSVPIFEREVRGRLLLEITVPQGATFYANAKGTSTRRVGHECRPFPPEEQRQALASRGLYDWSAALSGSVTYSEDEIVRLRRLLRAANKPDLAQQKPEAILQDLRLMNSAGELTNAGVLLVGDVDEIARLIPTYGYSYQYRATPGTEASARFRETRPLLAAIEYLLEAVDARKLVRPLNIAGGVQLTLQDYPPEAVRELVVNALVHRDYEVDGSVDIEQSPEQLRVTNPGGLVFGVTAENILSHPSTPRNRLLLETVTTLQIAERTGQGVDRAYRVLLRAGKKPPTFTDHGTVVEVSVPGGEGNNAFARYVNTAMPDALSADIEALLVLDALCVRRSVDASEVAPLIQRPGVGAQAALARLASAGLIEPSRRTASAAFPRYGLTSSALTGLGLAVAYHRRAADGLDDKVVEHVREYGYVTNQTIRRMFDLDLYPARDMLRDLQKREVLVKDGTQARGPGVRYVAGPRFPKRLS